MESTSIETAAAAAKPHHKNSPSPKSSVETIAAMTGVIAVFVQGDAERHFVGDDGWWTNLMHMIHLSTRGDFTGHVDDNVGLRALTRGDLSIAVAFKNDSPISKSLVRAMRKCLANIEAARTVAR